MANYEIAPEIPLAMSQLPKVCNNQLFPFVSAVIKTMYPASGVTAVIETMEPPNHHSLFSTLFSLLSTLNISL
jgi:hypothetical protein